MNLTPSAQLPAIDVPWSATEATQRTGLLVKISMVVLCICFMLLGHDWNRSLLLDEGFNVDETEMQERVSEGMLKYRLSFVTIGFVGVVLLLTNREQRFRVSALGCWILALIAWASASVLWSDDAGLTLRRLVTLSCSFVGMLGIARAFRPMQICWWAFLFTLAMAGLGLVAEVGLGTFRPWASEYRFAGLVHPNTQGVELSILLLSIAMLYGPYPKFRPLFLVVGIATVIGIVLTKSRTSAACCLVGFGALWLLNTSMRVKFASLMFGITTCGVVLVALLMMGVDDPDSFARVLQMGRDDDPTSFTGRIPIWVTLLDDVSSRPIFGHGFNTYFDEDTLAYIAKQHEWAVPNAHNAYIEMALNLGWVGVFLAVMTVSVAMYLISLPRVRATDSAYAMFFALAAFALLNSAFESTMVINFYFPPCLLAAGLLRLAFFEHTSETTHSPHSSLRTA